MCLPQNSKVKCLAYRIRKYIKQHTWVQSGCEQCCLSKSHVLSVRESHIMVRGFVSLKAKSLLLQFLGSIPLAIPQIYPPSSYFTPPPHHPLSQLPRTQYPTPSTYVCSLSGLMQSPTAGFSPCPTHAPIACLPHRTGGLLWPCSPSTLSHCAAGFPCGP